MRSDFYEFLGHDDRPVEQGEIADDTLSVFLNGERTTRINRNVIAENDRARFSAEHLFEDLRALAVEALAEINIGRNWLRIPIVFYMSILFDVAHVGNFPDANSFA